MPRQIRSLTNFVQRGHHWLRCIAWPGAIRNSWLFLQRHSNLVRRLTYFLERQKPPRSLAKAIICSKFRGPTPAHQGHHVPLVFEILPGVASHVWPSAHRHRRFELLLTYFLDRHSPPLDRAIEIMSFRVKGLCPAQAGHQVPPFLTLVTDAAHSWPSAQRQSNFPCASR
jgi:hypothetical protein